MCEAELACPAELVEPIKHQGTRHPPTLEVEHIEEECERVRSHRSCGAPHYGPTTVAQPLRLTLWPNSYGPTTMAQTLCLTVVAQLLWPNHYGPIIVPSDCGQPLWPNRYGPTGPRLPIVLPPHSGSRLARTGMLPPATPSVSPPPPSPPLHRDDYWMAMPRKANTSMQHNSLWVVLEHSTETRSDCVYASAKAMPCAATCA